MCGINGIYGNLPHNKGTLHIERMNNALVHRGPDGEGILSKNPIHLGHRSIKSNANHENAKQPIQDATGRYALVFDGELYNYNELKQSVAAYNFKSEAEAEVLLAGLIIKGIDFLKQCNGIFTIAFWDNQKGELILARDRLGVKPLYYARTHENLIFSSELRGILKSGLIPTRLNKDAIGNYLRYQTVHGTGTIIEGVYMLPPGSIMRFMDNEIKMHSYWDLVANARLEVAALSYDETKKLVRSKLEEAVEAMIVGNAGAFLSGGIDSSILVALASKHVSGLKTFNINFFESEYSEARFAKLVAEKYNTDHTEITLTPDTLLKEMPAAIRAMDHPSSDGFNTYVVSKLAKNSGISSAISGLGGDELFGGYPIFKQFHSLKDKGWLMSFPKFTRALAGNFLKIVRPGVASSKIRQVITEDYLDLENVYQYSREFNSRSVISKLTTEKVQGQNAVYHLVKEGVGYGTPGFDLPDLSKITYAELITYAAPILLRDSDQMGMAHALMLRIPFLYHPLVEAVMAIPDKYKFPDKPKKLLIDATEGLLPDEIINRPKMGFSFPWDEWMRNELKEFCGDQLLTLSKHDWFNEKAVLKRWDAFLKKDPEVTWVKIFPMCILQAWMTENEIE